MYGDTMTKKEKALEKKILIRKYKLRKRLCKVLKCKKSELRTILNILEEL